MLSLLYQLSLQKCLNLIIQFQVDLVVFVSLTDQWYIDYSNLEFESLNKRIYQSKDANDTRVTFEDALDWIYKLGFSRSFGLGTRIPWDEQYLIDSLSDSTIYKLFYTMSQCYSKTLKEKKKYFHLT